MADTDIPFPLTFGKLQTQTLGGFSNLTFFHTIKINEMAAIFQFFHNGRQLYSISINTWKTADPNFGGFINLIFFHMISILTKWQPYFNFFIMADTDIPFLSTLGKPQTQTLGGFSNLKFFCTININDMAAIFHFVHNGWH